MLLSSGDNFPHLIQKRRSQLGFVTFLLNYPRIMSLHINTSKTNREGKRIYWRQYVVVITAGRKTNVNPNYIHLKFRFVPRCKHSDSVIETSKLMQYREIIGVCSDIHTKHNNILCCQNVEFLVSSAECRKVTISCPSVHPHGTARLQPNGFS